MALLWTVVLIAILPSSIYSMTDEEAEFTGGDIDIWGTIKNSMNEAPKTAEEIINGAKEKTNKAYNTVVELVNDPAFMTLIKQLSTIALKVLKDQGFLKEIELIEDLIKWINEEGKPIDQALILMACKYPNMHRENTLSRACDNHLFVLFISAIPYAGSVCGLLWKYIPMIDKVMNVYTEYVCKEMSEGEGAVETVKRVGANLFENKAIPFGEMKLKKLKNQVKSQADSMLRTRALKGSDKFKAAVKGIRQGKRKIDKLIKG